MDPALVTCRGCSRTWHSITMAEGLRVIGACPRCGGELDWADGSGPAEVSVPVHVVTNVRGDAVAPHLVLGLPRR